MKPSRALTLAIRLCRLELKRMAFDRNTGLKYGAIYPEAVTAVKRSRELEQVITELELLKSDTMPLFALDNASK